MDQRLNLERTFATNLTTAFTTAVTSVASSMAARDWLSLNDRAARNVSAALQADAQRARDREEAQRAMSRGLVTELTRAQ